MSVADDVLKRFAVLATPTLANALDDVGFEGVLAGLSQVVPGTLCVGRALTVREITGRRGDFASEDFRVGQAGDIMVGDGSGVLCIPVEHAERVAELAESYARDDALAAEELRKGLTFSAAMAKFRRI